MTIHPLLWLALIAPGTTTLGSGAQRVGAVPFLTQNGTPPTLPAQDTTHLTLQTAVARALARYPTIGAARAAREGATADLGEAQSAWFPRLNVDAQLTRFQEPMIVQPLHGFDLANPPLFDRTLVQTGVSLNYTLWDFGARANRVRAARRLGTAADAALTSSELDVIEQTANAYLDVLALRDVAAAEAERRKALEAEADRVRQWLTEGKAARVESLRAQAELARARADEIATAGQLEVAERAFGQLVDLDPTFLASARLDHVALRDTAGAPEDRSELASRARRANADLIAARQRADAARAAASALRATRFPELRLSGGYIDRGRATGDFVAEWQASVGMSYPLFTGGQRTSAIHRAEADADLAAERARQAELMADQQVDRALAAWREAHAKVAALELAVAQSGEVARIEQLSLEVGSGTQTDYLDAEASLLRARASLIQARYAEVSARIALARATGDLSLQFLTGLLEPRP